MRRGVKSLSNLAGNFTRQRQHLEHRQQYTLCDDVGFTFLIGQPQVFHAVEEDGAVAQGQ
jgi:hypothetical protein